MWIICVTNDHIYVLFVVITFWVFPHSWIITWFVKRVTQQVSHVEQELHTLPGHMSSLHADFSELDVARSLMFCVVFCRLLPVLLLLAIVFSVLHWFMTLITPLSIFKHFINDSSECYWWSKLFWVVVDGSLQGKMFWSYSLWFPL